MSNRFVIRLSSANARVYLYLFALRPFSAFAFYTTIMMMIIVMRRGGIIMAAITLIMRVNERCVPQLSEWLKF